MNVCTPGNCICGAREWEGDTDCFGNTEADDAQIRAGAAPRDYESGVVTRDLVMEAFFPEDYVKTRRTLYSSRALGLTEPERRTYQALIARGFSPQDAKEEALDGVSIEEVRKMKGTDMNRQQRLDMAQRTIERAQAQIEKILNRKEEPRGKKRNVIFYRKKFDNGITYTYAAVRAKGLWYTTGPKSPKGFTWDELLDWLGDDVKIWVPTGWEELR